MSINILLALEIVCVLSTFGSGLGSIRKIVGGSTATSCEDPHIVYLKIFFNNTSFMCGGSLLDETHVLTAAHCLNFSEKVLVKVGSLNFKEMPTEIEVKSYELHPSYEISGENGNDVAVLKLTNSIHFTDCIKPIYLAADNDTKYETCFIAGWGKVYGESNVASDYLQRAQVNLMAEEICLDIIPKEEKDQLICVGDKENGAAGCHGDPGGPLTCVHPLTGHPTLVGVASWGISNCDKGTTVYTRISYYKTWIDITVDS
uniref:S1 type peptidase n=1 Tax=Sepia latimanus TaxID=3248881 RepID=B6Z1W9_SEPLA|nr:S1 type peptidase [Sepia latimanus]